MHCPTCASNVIANDRYCQTCGTRFRPQRVLFAPERKEFALTPEEESWGLGEERLVEHSQLPSTQPHGSQQGRAVNDNAGSDVQWGGFLRRGLAFVIDLLIVCLISVVLFVLCYIGYKVGLAAHDRTLSPQSSEGLVAFLGLSWMFIVTSYFVIFHGLEGQTVGKWLLGLRVIGEHGARVSYKRASLRWLGELVFAPLVLGLLWIIWSREKRAWHDYLARTWVVRG